MPGPYPCRLPRGIPAASLKPAERRRYGHERIGSSAGNTRGLIEASPAAKSQAAAHRLPRGIPAASLKPPGPARGPRGRCSCCLPRGIPAASLKLSTRAYIGQSLYCLPRGIPAASLKPGQRERRTHSRMRLPRGIPAASLKPAVAGQQLDMTRRLPRGIPAASLKHITRLTVVISIRWSSAGNTRGLIEARLSSQRRMCLSASSAGNTRGLIEARLASSAARPVAVVFRGEYPRPH